VDREQSPSHWPEARGPARKRRLAAWFATSTTVNPVIAHRIDALERAVERGPDGSLIAPSTITNFFVPVLQEQDAREQDAGVADEHAAGSSSSLTPSFDPSEQRIRIVLRARWLVFA
jgi:hypothetical protein